MNTTEGLRKYELMLIFSGEIPEAQFERELADFKKSLQETSKSITHEDNWGLRNLAFRLKRQSRGHYVVFNFEADPSQIIELRSNIRLNPVVLRHMLITVPDSYVPGHHEDVVLFRDEKKNEDTGVSSSRKKPSIKEVHSEKGTTPKEEEQLKTVEKKLEKILENPDLDIK